MPQGVVGVRECLSARGHECAKAAGAWLGHSLRRARPGHSPKWARGAAGCFSNRRGGALESGEGWAAVRMTKTHQTRYVADNAAATAAAIMARPEAAAGGAKLVVEPATAGACAAKPAPQTALTRAAAAAYVWLSGCEAFAAAAR